MLTNERENSKAWEAAELTSYMVRKHYEENDVEAVIALMDEDIIWLGAAEHEYAVGRETVASIFRPGAQV